MMRWIVTQSLRFRFLVVAVGAAMMVFGIGQLRDMPLDVFPEFAPPRVEIQTACLGLTAEEVESLVTVPLEQALNATTGLDVMRSKSVSQLSSIELLFHEGTDLLHARQLVQERLATVANTLPTWAAPPVMLPPLSATSRVMKVGISSSTTSLEDMSLTAYWKIRARLLRVPGVANVPIWGERLKVLQVEVDPAKLRANSVTLNSVMEVTANALDAGILKFADGGFIGTGGFVDTSNQRLGVRHVLPIVTAGDLANVVVAERAGSNLRIGDVARVIYEEPPLAGDAVINDGPGLMLIVEKLPWGNTLDVTRGVEKAIDEMRPGLPELQIDTTIFRPATFVEDAIRHLGRSILLGALLIVVVLVLFLFDWRAALISVVTIPLSLVAAGLVLSAFGATLNTMVLAGLVIALGAIVDDGIVDVENIVRRLRQARLEGASKSTARVILDASLEVRGAVVYASFIEVMALVPIFFLTGLTGSFFRPLAFSYAVAVLVSLLVALVSTPALSLILFSKGRIERRESPVSRWLRRGYVRLLRPIVQRPWPAYGGVLALVFLGLTIAPRLGESLFPAFKEKDFLMHWVSNPGTSLPEEARITTQSSRELRAIPGVRNFGAHIGQALQGDEVHGVEFGENWISIEESADYDKTVTAIQEVVAGYPGMYTDVQTYLKERMSEVLTGASEPVVVRIFGHDLATLRAKADEVKEQLGAVPGIVDEHVELQVEIPQLEIEVDLAKAQQHGIKPGDVRRAASALMAGEEVGDIFRDGKAYDVNVWSIPEVRRSVTDIGELLLDVPGGGHVRLADVATVTLRPTPNTIEHEGGVRRVDVAANVRGRDLGAVVRDVESRLATVQFPLEYHAELLGEYKERQAAQNRLATFAGVAVVGVFLILLAVLRKFRLAVLAFITLPVALVGGVVGAWLAGGTISIGSLVGFFTVLGIVARNGIMLVSHFQYLEDEEGVPFGPALVVQGAAERLPPIMMTVLATGLALVPLMVAGNVAGQEIEYPMGAVILGGLVTSTILNLFIVPPLYLRFAKSRSQRRGLEAAPA